MASFRYLAVEGPIGAGKTSLARRLAERFGADLLLEQPGENPFLERFYRDMARHALPTQLFFLFQRARQLEPLAQPDYVEIVDADTFEQVVLLRRNCLVLMAVRLGATRLLDNMLVEELGGKFEVSL